MGILTRLRNAFGRSRKSRTAEAEGAAPTTQAPAEPTTPEAAAPARVPSPSPEPDPTPTATVPEPRDEHDLVSLAFDNVTVPRPTRSDETEQPPTTPEPAAETPERTEEPERVASTPEPAEDKGPEQPAKPEVAEPEVAEQAAKPEVASEPEGAEQAAEPEVAAEPEAKEAAPADEPVAAKPDAADEPAPAEAVETAEAAEAAAAETTDTEPQPQGTEEPTTPAETPKADEPEAEAPDTKPEPEAEAEARDEKPAEPESEPESESAAEAEATTPEPAAADGEEAPQGPPAPDDESRTGGAGGNDTAETEGEAEAEAEAEAEPKAPKPALTLAQLKTRAPALATAYRAAATTLKTHDLTGTRAKVYLVLDRSASMRPYYKDGSAQALAEQTLALAAHLDPEATVPVVFFSTELDGTGEITLTDHENKIDTLHASLGRMGRTSYHAAVEAVLAHHDKATAETPGLPALVVFQTDGAPDAKTPATQALTDAAESHPAVFFSFVAFGDPENKAFDYLRKLKTPNTSHFLAGETPRELTDKELYEGVLANWRP